jgi:hypothetical protein
MSLLLPPYPRSFSKTPLFAYRSWRSIGRAASRPVDLVSARHSLGHSSILLSSSAGVVGYRLDRDPARDQGGRSAVSSSLASASASVGPGGERS